MNIVSDTNLTALSLSFITTIRYVSHLKHSMLLKYPTSYHDWSNLEITKLELSTFMLQIMYNQ